MGPQLEYLETILTCKGNFYSPDFSSHLDDLKRRLQELVFSDDNKKLVVKKVEPWNSVRVTLKMPIDAAHKLKKLAEQRDRMLHEIGVLEVQIEGDNVISLAIDTSKSESLEQLSENGRRSVNIADTPCCSGQCVPSTKTLKTFASLPQSTNVEWPLFTKLLNSINDRSSVKVNICHSSVEPRVLVSCLQASPQCSNLSIISSPSYQNSINFPESCNFTQNASYPFELHTYQANKSWLAGEEKFISCQNIASSSPLLVNLLKSPGGRTPLNSSSMSIRSDPVCELSSDVAVPAQKRKRNQTRKSKRLKEGTECANSSSQSFQQGIPCSFATFQQDSIRISSQINVSESRQMINPYTGDLEVIEECEEPSNSTLLEAIGHFKELGPNESSITHDNNTISVKTLESRVTSTSNLPEKIDSSQSSIVSSSHNGALGYSPTSDASFDFSLRSNMETSTPACFKPSIPVYNLQNTIVTTQGNMNIPHSFASPVASSHPENGLLLNHTLSSCYMQNMLKALSSENVAKLFASQSLILPTTINHSQDESKSIIDANSLAKIIVQSSLMPKSLDTIKNVDPVSTDTRPAVYNTGSAFLNSNGQLPKQFVCNSRLSSFSVVPHDDKIASCNNFGLKEASQQLNLVGSQTLQKLTRLNNMVTSTQATQLMKEMFPCLSLPAFSAAASIPATCITYNGQVKSSLQDQISNNSSAELLKKPYFTDARTINGCYNSPVGQISDVQNLTSDSSILIQSSLSSTAISSDCDGTMSTPPIVPHKSLAFRKPTKNVDDTMPTKSKANLTVAQLLEQVEIAKNHLAFSGSLIQKSISETSLTYINSLNVGTTKPPTAKSDQKNELAFNVQRSLSSSHCSFGHPQKSITYSNSMSFNVLDSLPMPITSPRYPHNLTESVQKAMRGVGFDNSPSTSPPLTRHPQSRQPEAVLQANLMKGTCEKQLSNLRGSVGLNKDSTGLTDFDILGNQFELRQLEEALKCTLKHQELDQSESQKHLIDLDATDLDFVFNAEDESHLESIIALRDYDDIETLAETLASNIDGSDIDEDILISEKDLESLNHGSVVCRTSKCSCTPLPGITSPICDDNDIIRMTSSILKSSGQTCMGYITKHDPKNEVNITNPLEENFPKHATIDETLDKTSEIPVERTKCKSSSKKITNVTTNYSNKNPEFVDETTSHPISNRMATRSSNKQKSISISIQNDLLFEELTSVSSRDLLKNTSDEAMLQPLLRRSNRTIRKTELAVESLHAKSIERSKKIKDEGHDNKFNPSPSAKAEHSSKVFRQKSSQKRKYNSRCSNMIENVQTTANEVHKDQASLKRIEHVSSTSGPLEFNVIESDFILCNKRPKTS